MNKTFRMFTIYIGSTTRKGLIGEADNFSALRGVERKIAEKFDGFSRTATAGQWRTPEGQLINRSGYRYEIAAPISAPDTDLLLEPSVEDTVYTFARSLGHAMDQREVLLIKNGIGELLTIEYGDGVAPTLVNIASGEDVALGNPLGSEQGTPTPSTLQDDGTVITTPVGDIPTK